MEKNINHHALAAVAKEKQKRYHRRMKLDGSSTRLGFVVGEKLILLPGTEARSVILLAGLTELPQL
jgi:hypothetical protein